jgi:hypothetical protein
MVKIKGFYDDGRRPVPVWWTQEMCCGSPFLARDKGGNICRNCGLVWVSMPKCENREFESADKKRE